MLTRNQNQDQQSFPVTNHNTVPATIKTTQGLPVGWQAKIDRRSQRKYYEDTIDKVTQWERPKEIKPPDSRYQDQQSLPKFNHDQDRGTIKTTPGLPIGWEAKIDKASQHVYYIDHIDKTTQWHCPKNPADQTGL